MQLKGYQERALDQLRFFLQRCRGGDFAMAHAETIARIDEPDSPVAGDCAGAYAKGPYTPVEGVPDCPYACIRLPTGGGKTLLAAHAIKVAADAWMDRERVPVVWLVPSNPILTQTLDALRQPRHPYRQALQDAFGDVAVFDIDERRQIRPRDLLDKTVVIVATYQTFRITNISERNVYRTDENLEDHFRTASLAEGLEVEDSGPRKGDIRLSFANLLYRQRPLFILDEAHNFMTGLARDVKARLRPKAIVEFTATPARGSNVVSAATAAELKAAEMIKMPIHLAQHPSWQQAVNAAVMQRTALGRIGADDPQAIRPIVLYQAQPATEGAEATVESLKQHLIEVERVDAAEIAVATGDQRGLDGVDLFDPACRIKHVITVQALKEGWDCSFAYIFCSVASIRSPGAVEQLLGRVLRMPFAKRRASEELNRAYAHVSEPNFYEAAKALQDRLVEMGFDEQAAREAVIAENAPAPLALEGGETAPLYSAPRPPVHELPARPDTTRWSDAARAKVRMAEAGGTVTVVVAADAPDAVHREVAREIERFVPGSVESVERYIAQAALARSPAERGVRFAVPRVQLTVQGELDLAETESYIDLAGWDLLDDPVKATLPGFAIREQADGYVFDIDGDQIVHMPLDAAIELALDEGTDWDAGALARFLDRRSRQIHTPQPMYLEYCRRVVGDLLERRGFTLAGLVRGKFLLQRAVIERVARLREETARRGVQMLFDGHAVAGVVADDAWLFQPHRYQVSRWYEGRFRPAKHFYARMAHMNDKEARCAEAIDRLPTVKHWVRNLDRVFFGYSLPTSRGNFFPDFVAELIDGTLFLIEYKGRTDDYDKEKDNVGRAFAEASGGRLRYVTVWEDDPAKRDNRAQLEAALG